jgi:hypothetical protein
MVFAEQKKENGFIYKVEDVFGEIEIVSPLQLSGIQLDRIVLAIMRAKARKGGAEGGITFTFNPKADWENEEPVV